MVVASDEPSPHRRELRRHVPGSGQLRTPAESHDRPDSSRRAVRERLSGKRRHSRPGVSIAGFQLVTQQFLPVEGVAFACHGFAQPQGRLSAGFSDRRPHVVHQQPEPDLPRQQRRAESVDRIGFPVGERYAYRLGCAVCAGAMDTRSRDLAGRCSFRSRGELVSRATGRAIEVPPRRHRRARDARCRQLQGHHAESRRHVRRVRHRQNRAQAPARKVSGGCWDRRQLREQ